MKNDSNIKNNLNRNSEMVDIIRESIEDNGYIFISENIVVKETTKQNLTKNEFYVTIIGNQYSLKKIFTSALNKLSTKFKQIKKDK